MRFTLNSQRDQSLVKSKRNIYTANPSKKQIGGYLRSLAYGHRLDNLGEQLTIPRETSKALAVSTKFSLPG